MLKNKLGIQVYTQDTRNENVDNNFIQHFHFRSKIRNEYSRIIGNAGHNRFIFFGIDLIKRYKYEK